jgi:MFS family permease
MTMLDVSIVNVALPSIEHSLAAGPTQLQLIVAGYTLAFGLTLAPAGRLGDVYGRRAVFVVGVAAFGAMSLAAGLSTTDLMLSLSRLGQGAAAGILNPQVSGLIQQLFRGPERGRAFGVFGATIGLSTALGPLAGGLIIAFVGPEHGWRWVFLINLPVVAALIPAAVKLLPPPGPRPPGRRRLDSFGVTLVGVATVALMTPFVLTGDAGEDLLGAQRWWGVVAAAALVPAIYLWERRYQRKFSQAALNPALLKNPDFRYGAAVGATYFASFTAIFLVVVLMAQDGLGYTPLQSGLIGVPFAITSGVAAFRSGRWVARHGRWTVVAGLAVALAGLAATDLALRLAPEGAVGWVVTATLCLAGFGSGAVISPNQTLTLAGVDPATGSMAGAVLQVGQRIGTCVGIAAVLAGFFDLREHQGPRLAAANSLLVCLALMALTLGLALADARRRTHGPAHTRTDGR